MERARELSQSQVGGHSKRRPNEDTSQARKRQTVQELNDETGTEVTSPGVISSQRWFFWLGFI